MLLTSVTSVNLRNCLMWQFYMQCAFMPFEYVISFMVMMILAKYIHFIDHPVHSGSWEVTGNAELQGYGEAILWRGLYTRRQLKKQQRWEKWVSFRYACPRNWTLLSVVVHLKIIPWLLHLDTKSNRANARAKKIHWTVSYTQNGPILK